MLIFFTFIHVAHIIDRSSTQKAVSIEKLYVFFKKTGWEDTFHVFHIYSKHCLASLKIKPLKCILYSFFYPGPVEVGKRELSSLSFYSEQYSSICPIRLGHGHLEYF